MLLDKDKIAAMFCLNTANRFPNTSNRSSQKGETALKTTLLILVVLLADIAYGANYVVSGAGTSAVNGTYTESGTYNSKPQYQLGATDYYLKYNNNGPARWEIWNNMETRTYYYTDASGVTPPSTGWTRVMYGQSPAPSVLLEGPNILYSVSVFQESSANNGAMGNTITITCNNYGGLTFTGTAGDNFVSGSKVTVTNVPAGLTAVITKVDDVTLTASLTGTTSSHASVNDVSNLTFTFQNSAFSSNNASVVLNSTKTNLVVNFVQQYIVAASGGDYTTIAAALAASGNGDVIQINAGTYTENSLQVASDVTIHGQSAATTIVQAAASAGIASARVFTVPTGVTATITDLTIRYGNVVGNPGGGIYSTGTLTLSNSTVCDNTSTSGGGFYSNGTAFINGCTIKNNSAADGNGGGCMGNGTMELKNSTITGNSASDNGGGIYVPVSLTMTITNCTIANNTATQSGDGLYANYGTLIIKNTILAGNGTVDYYVYSGVYLTDVGNNIVQNQSYSNSPSNWYFNQTSDILYSHNYLGAAKGSWNKYNEAVSGSLNVSASLADNNSANGTQTLALTSGSFAIDAGTATGAPTTDQRGAGRNGAVDIGAYEWWSNAGILPVELTAFTASSAKNGVTLNWNTATEANNYGFDIERKSTSSWTKVGFVEGHGTTNAPQSYRYSDNAATGNIVYRLKQIDRDGKFEYSKEVVVSIVATPAVFALSQNYPNPFNPTTVINYSIASASLVSLKVFDLLGREVAVLVNETMAPGSYMAAFDASRLSSGIYFYRLDAGSFSDVKRLTVMK